MCAAICARPDRLRACCCSYLAAWLGLMDCHAGAAGGGGPGRVGGVLDGITRRTADAHWHFAKCLVVADLCDGYNAWQLW